MSYTGSKLTIPFGKSGVRTDDPNAELEAGELFRAINVDMYEGLIQKTPGSVRWNAKAQLSSAIIAANDWQPVDGLQRVVVCDASGKMWRFKNAFRKELITPAPIAGTVTTATPVLTPIGQPHFCAGGQQDQSVDRKLFFFSGSNLPQVIDGEALVRHDIKKPAAEWVDGNFPTYGIIFKGKLFTLGTRGAPHRILSSTAADHEDFTTLTGGDPVTTYEVFPGEGERVATMWVFRGKLFAAKFPQGVYVLNDTAATSAGWYFEKVSSSLGAISAHATSEVVDDMLVANQFGTISSMSAAFQLGQVKFADVVANMRVEQSVRQETRPMVGESRWTLFYPDKKLALFTYRSTSGTVTDKVFCLDFAHQKPKAYFLDKDRPLCLFLMKDVNGKQIPCYGGTDGYIYMMDQPVTVVGAYDPVTHTWSGVGYATEVRVPYMDFGQPMNKNFDFLEIELEHTGIWNLSCDVHIDDSYAETLQFKCATVPVLRAAADASCFQLDSSRLLGKQTRQFRLQLHGRGRNIAFRFYTDSTIGQNFRLTKAVVYARISDEGKKS